MRNIKDTDIGLYLIFFLIFAISIIILYFSLDAVVCLKHEQVYEYVLEGAKVQALWHSKYE
jgi:hypothetical protein